MLNNFLRQAELGEGVVEEGEEPAGSCLEGVEVLSYQGEEVSFQDVVDGLHIEITYSEGNILKVYELCPEVWRYQ